MSKQNGQGLMALLGIGVGLFAWYKYKNMSPEKKEQLHGKIREVGDSVKDTLNDMGDSVSKSYEQVKNGAKKEMDELSNKY